MVLLRTQKPAACLLLHQPLPTPKKLLLSRLLVSLLLLSLLLLSLLHARIYRRTLGLYTSLRPKTSVQRRSTAVKDNLINQMLIIIDAIDDAPRPYIPVETNILSFCSDHNPHRQDKNGGTYGGGIGQRCLTTATAIVCPKSRRTLRVNPSTSRARK